MVSVLVRGRPAWIAGLVLGVILLVIGIALGVAMSWATGGWLVGGGGALALFGAIFLVLSLVSGGRTD